MSINRRDLLKALFGGAIVASIPGVTVASAIKPSPKRLHEELKPLYIGLTPKVIEEENLSSAIEYTLRVGHDEFNRIFSKWLVTESEVKIKDGIRYVEVQTNFGVVDVPLYSVSSAVDWPRESRYHIVERALQVFNKSFKKKDMDDGFQTIIRAGFDRNIVCYNSDVFPDKVVTPRFISMMKEVMRKNGNGDGGRLTNLYVSPEVFQATRNYYSGVLPIPLDKDKIVCLGVEIRDIMELGEGQQFQLFYNNELKGSLPTNTSELVVGLDLSKDDFIEIIVSPGITVCREKQPKTRRDGYYGIKERGIVCCNNKSVLLGAI